MASVILRLHEAVELAVIDSGDLVLPLLRLSEQPVLEALANLLNLSIGELRLLGVLHLQVLGLLVIHAPALSVALILHHLRAGVLQRMHQQLDTVDAFRRLARYRVLAPNLLVPRRCTGSELIQQGVVLDGDHHLAAPVAALLRILRHRKELTGKVRIHLAVHPPLTQIEVQILERDRRRHGSFEGLCRLIHHHFIWIADITLGGFTVKHVCNLWPQFLNLLQLFNNIS